MLKDGSLAAARVPTPAKHHCSEYPAVIQQQIAAIKNLLYSALCRAGDAGWFVGLGVPAAPALRVRGAGPLVLLLAGMSAIIPV